VATLDTGLRYRVQRVQHQMRAQHRHLHPFFDEIQSALARRDGAPVEDGLERLAEALEAHFDLEDEVLFPALHGLHPERGEEIAALSEDHGELLGALARLFDALRDAALARFAEDFDAFREDLARHEAREEQLIQRLVGA
jgi:iron-sulfur cluster repair protein YtfE (RIC family)